MQLTARRWGWLSVLVVLSACTGPGLPKGLVPGKGGSCTRETDCSSCSGCRLPGREVCVEGTCYLASAADASGNPTLTDGMVVATLPSGVAAQAKSAAVRIYYPLRTDGSKVTCAALLADPTAVDGDGTLNVLRTLTPGIGLPGTVSQVDLGANQLPVGTDRVALVRIHAQPGGAGTLLSVGCNEHLALAAGAACHSDADCTYPKKCEIVSGQSECGPQQIVVKTSRP